jgi:hypothetical protein
MISQDALIELLARVGAAHGESVFVSDAELRLWPVAAVAALKSQKLLVKARPAVSVVCPGCERECVMPVRTLTRANGATASFVVCDKRDDINRVGISNDLLTQWRCNAEAVCGFVAKSVGIRRSEQRSTSNGLWNIGMARGAKRSQMLCLRADGELALVAGNNAVPLAELFGFRDGKYSVDAATIRELVDAATTADPRYTPSNARRETRKLDTQEMYEGWRKAYRALKKQHRDMSDVWYARQIAKMEIAKGKNSETIRKHMKK